MLSLATILSLFQMTKWTIKKQLKNWPNCFPVMGGATELQSGMSIGWALPNTKIDLKCKATFVFPGLIPFFKWKLRRHCKHMCDCASVLVCISEFNLSCRKKCLFKDFLSCLLYVDKLPPFTNIFANKNSVLFIFHFIGVFLWWSCQSFSYIHHWFWNKRSTFQVISWRALFAIHLERCLLMAMTTTYSYKN